MSFSKERLICIREKMGISKAEAARRLNLTPMGYGRYENGDRVPSYQMICHIAQVFGTSYEYLCDASDDSKPTSLLIAKEDDPSLFDLAKNYSEMDDKDKDRLIAYYKKLLGKKHN